MICIHHSNFESRIVSRVVRCSQARYHEIVRLVITCAFFNFFVTISIANAQTQNLTEVLDISFRDFFQRPVGLEGLLLNEQILKAQGRQVRLTGFMVQQEKIAPGRFLLAQRPVLMSQHADGEADDLPPATVLVELAPEQQDSFVAYTKGVVDVVGELDVGRKEGMDGRVSWLRLRLPSNGTREMNAFEFITYQHSIAHRH